MGILATNITFLDENNRLLSNADDRTLKFLVQNAMVCNLSFMFKS